MECDEVYFFVDDRLYNADPLTEFPKNEYDWKHLKMVYAFEDKIKSRYKSCIDIIGHLEREERNNYYFFTNSFRRLYSRIFNTEKCRFYRRRILFLRCTQYNCQDA